MAKYAIEFKLSARKELEKLSAQLVQRIFPRLEILADEPRPAGCKKLKGGHDEYRIRAGDYRVVYVIDDRRRVVTIVRIRNRSEVYD